MWWRDSIWGINDTHLCTIIILYKMKVHVVKDDVVKDDVETEIPDVAVKKYLQENSASAKSSAKKRSKKNNRKRSRHTRR